jgi:16S rRNA (cytosine967-C5)-methyltransferase
MALELLGRYDGSLPFHLFLKKYFQQNRRCGSRDRRQIRALCFAWFRCSGLLNAMEPVERMKWSLYLVTEQRDVFFDRITGDENGSGEDLNPEEPLSVKLRRVCDHTGKTLEDAFPLCSEVSRQVDARSFLTGLFIQPKVWLRVRARYRNQVESALKDSEIPFMWNPHNPNALSIPPETVLEPLQIIENGWAEVQDLSSQRTISYMHAREREHWYDACAASGGKSLLLKDACPDTVLTVSDSRETVLRNLEERFRRNGLPAPRMFVCDLLREDPNFEEGNLPEAIIADVPCSGSGTWSRTPERLAFFNREELNRQVELQRSISTRLVQILQPGGKLVYITCSVYACENERQVEELCKTENMRLLTSGYLQGSSERADTLFCAELVKR